MSLSSSSPVLINWHDKNIDCHFCSESITDNITVDENEDSLGKIVSSGLSYLIGKKFNQYTKFDT